MKRRKYGVFLLITGALMLVLNHLTTPTLSDDVLYRFIFQFDESLPPQPVGSLADIWQSQTVHYYTTNGRVIIHAVVQLVLWAMNEHVFYVLNAAFFVLLVHLCCRFIKAERTHELLAAVLFSAIFFLITSGFQSEMLWSVGSVNYLWTTVVTLLFLLFLRRVVAEPLRSPWVAVSPLAFFVGWSHEALFLPLLLVFILYVYVHRRTVIRSAAFPFFLFYMLGGACCLCSPALWGRADVSMTLQRRLLLGVVNFIYYVRVSWLLLLTVLIAFKWQRGALLRQLKAWRYAYLAWLLMLGIVFVCGNNNERTGFYADFAASLLLVSLLLAMGAGRYARPVTAVLCTVMALVAIPAVYYNYKNSENYAFLKAQMDARGQSVVGVKKVASAASCVPELLISRYVQEPVEFGFYSYYQAFDANGLNNRCAARLHGKHELTFLPADVVECMLADSADSRQYERFELDEQQQLYVGRLRDKLDVQRVVFHLNKEVDGLRFYQRWLSYPDSTYELQPEQFKTVELNGRYYLVMVKPTTNIYRRISEITYR